MKRRKFIQHAGAGALASLGLYREQRAAAQTAVTLQWLGHTCFLFTGGQRVLVNPFRTIGCTAGYRPPEVTADVVMTSSLLFDEGWTQDLPGSPRKLADPGIYELASGQVQGIVSDHDLKGGRQFGTNVMWRWNQGGLTILHMGGAAAPITDEQRILIAQVDVVIIPVGGGPKAYGPQAARDAIAEIEPKIVIPAHYRTGAADPETCSLQPLDDFLSLMDAPVRQVGNSTALTPASLPESGYRIDVFSYSF
ncbi:MAG: MBL fold metallo-hydrolase [Cyanobacteria bacterium P01_A01_bin.135]